MCGLAGIVDRDEKGDIQNVLEAMADALKMRGPDDYGCHVFPQKPWASGFAHTRLSINDLSSAAKQPMSDASGRYTIIFNGEIYNFKELAYELEGLGVRFKTGSDTEVLLQTFIRWGVDGIKKCRGMFVFAIMDTQTDKLTLCRDRMGVKPCFVYKVPGLLLFASELKALHCHPKFKKTLNLDAVANYFRYGYVPTPECIFENCFKLEPGTLLTFDIKNDTFEKETFWSLAECYSQPESSLSYNDAKQQLEALLIESFNLRLVGDVPMGVFLSGGVDSSLVAACLQTQSSQKIKTFSIGFSEEKYNEADYAERVANCLQTEHHNFICTHAEAMSLIDDLPMIYDEPFADSSAIPTLLLSRHTRKHVTVALSGDGGDETFAGYERHRLHYWLSKIPRPCLSLSKLIPGGLDRPKIKLLKPYLEEQGAADIAAKIADIRLFTDHQLLGLGLSPPNLPSSLKDASPEGRNLLTSLLAIDSKMPLMDDMLQKIDRATMSVGLEGREPLLDHKMIEFAARLPLSYKINSRHQKRILKDILATYLPRPLFERPKMGFGVPLESWLSGPLSHLLDDYLNESRIQKEGVLEPESVAFIVKQFKKTGGKNSHIKHGLWSLLMFEMWMEQWVN